MKNVLFSGFVAAALLLATPAIAKVYVCQLKDQSNSGWIPEVAVVDYDESTGVITVLDPIIEHYKEAAIPGRIATKNDKRITFAWVLDNFSARAPGRNQFVSGMRYRLTIQNSSLRATITAKPNGYRNDFRGKGQCEIR